MSALLDVSDKVTAAPFLADPVMLGWHCKCERESECQRATHVGTATPSGGVVIRHLHLHYLQLCFFYVSSTVYFLNVHSSCCSEKVFVTVYKVFELDFWV